MQNEMMIMMMMMRMAMIVIKQVKQVLQLQKLLSHDDDDDVDKQTTLMQKKKIMIMMRMIRIGNNDSTSETNIGVAKTISNVNEKQTWRDAADANLMLITMMIMMIS